MNQTVKIRELSPRATSRLRGEAAFQRLQSFLNRSGEVRLEFEQDDLTTGSFLDELVRLLNNVSQLNRITFVNLDKSTKEKLQRIAVARNVAIFYSNENRERTTLETLALAPEKPAIVEDKSTFVDPSESH